MNPTLCIPLETAKKIAALGVKVESEKKYCGGHNWYDKNDDGEFRECNNTDILDNSDEYCHTVGLTCEFIVAAYTLGELPAVLEAIGKVKRWGFEDRFYCGNKDCKQYNDKNNNWVLRGYCRFCGIMQLQFTRETGNPNAAFFFSEICKLYFKEPKKGWSYLDNLLK